MSSLGRISRFLLKRRGASDGPEPAPDLAGWLDDVRIAATQQVGPLEVVPLIRNRVDGAVDVLAPEALKQGWLEVSERGEGVVQELEARNAGPRPVLVLEGDTLVGCKQNRIVACSVIIAPGASVVIPVGCMEQGRWSQGGSAFAPGSMRAEPWVRSEGVRETARARREGRKPKLSQSRLWSQVACSMSAHHKRSGSGDYHLLLDSWSSNGGSDQSDFVGVTGQIGMIALWQGCLLGIELAGHPATWKRLGKRTLPAYVLATESARRGAWGDGPPRADGRSAQAWLDTVRGARVRTYPGLGAGVDLELRGGGLSGAGLWHDGELKHLVAFRETAKRAG